MILEIKREGPGGEYELRDSRMERNNSGNCPEEVRMEGYWEKGRQLYLEGSGHEDNKIMR